MKTEFKHGKPTHDGWWRFFDGEYWRPADVDCDATLFKVFDSDSWDCVDQTTDDQWAGEIEMPDSNTGESGE